MEAGQLQLIGTLDTTDIERGQRKIQVGFDNVQAKTDSSVGSLSSLAGVSKGLLATFAGLGTVASGAIIGIAANAPQTAGSIARIKAQSQQLSFAVGEELAPAFESAADLYAKFVDSASTEGTILNSGVELFGDSLQGVLSDLNSLIGLVEKVNNLNLPDWITGGEGGSTVNKQTGRPKAQTVGDIQENYIDNLNFDESFIGAITEHALNVINPSNMILSMIDSTFGTKTTLNPISLFRNRNNNNDRTALDAFNEHMNNMQINSTRNSTFNTTDTMGGNLDG